MFQCAIHNFLRLQADSSLSGTKRHESFLSVLESKRAVTASICNWLEFCPSILRLSVQSWTIEGVYPNFLPLKWEQTLTHAQQLLRELVKHFQTPS